jgi:hypothetical protein
VIRELEHAGSEGARRNFLKILAEVPVKLTHKDKSVLVNLCFDFLEENFSVAVKVFSMQILYNLSLEMPDIGIELTSLIMDNLPDATPGYRSRAEKILKNLQKRNFQIHNHLINKQKML